MADIPTILHMIPYFRPALEFGGPTAVSDLLVSGLGSMGFNIRVWTSDVRNPSGERVARKWAHEPSAPIVRYRYVFRPLFRRTNLLITPGMALASLLADESPDLIHLHEFRSFQAACAYILARRCDIPLLLQPHGSLEIALGRAGLKRVYDTVVGNRLLHHTTRIIALSTSEADKCRSLGIPASRIVVIPNGVPPPEEPPQRGTGRFRTKHGIGSNDLVILFLGRVRASKGLSLLLDAFEDFSKKFPRSTLAICGPDDGAGEMVKASAARRNLTVVMTGMLVGEDKHEALSDCDIFCLPSAFETQSVALLEAASYALPVVASPASVPTEFARNRAGMFVGLDREQLADAFVTLADSRPLRLELGERAKETVKQHFSSQSMLEKVSELYRNVLSET